MSISQILTFSREKSGGGHRTGGKVGAGVANQIFRTEESGDSGGGRNGIYVVHDRKQLACGGHEKMGREIHNVWVDHFDMFQQVVPYSSHIAMERGNDIEFGKLRTTPQQDIHGLEGRGKRSLPRDPFIRLQGDHDGLPIRIREACPEQFPQAGAFLRPAGLGQVGNQFSRRIQLLNRIFIPDLPLDDSAPSGSDQAVHLVPHGIQVETAAPDFVRQGKFFDEKCPHPPWHIFDSGRYVSVFRGGNHQIRIEFFKCGTYQCGQIKIPGGHTGQGIQIPGIAVSFSSEGIQGFGRTNMQRPDSKNGLTQPQFRRLRHCCRAHDHEFIRFTQRKIFTHLAGPIQVGGQKKRIIPENNRLDIK
ncbi:hypothetical protein JIN84_10755 [Luteolibacter yonseiensis]|uniref:Uncharacterized protein n=1 Tax=Luteolibacter yonseiensis TaxID=1144680 RepID=A0A934R462_9BACT|nr:hypothetical protein [Luteolibacter yonseiensis]MBK1816092.1 hypothetical protein [Luteolibacter yonseiensis]